MVAFGSVCQLVLHQAHEHDKVPAVSSTTTYNSAMSEENRALQKASAVPRNQTCWYPWTSWLYKDAIPLPKDARQLTKVYYYLVICKTCWGPPYPTKTWHNILVLPIEASVSRRFQGWSSSIQVGLLCCRVCMYITVIHGHVMYRGKQACHLHNVTHYTAHHQCIITNVTWPPAPERNMPDLDSCHHQPTTQT